MTLNDDIIRLAYYFAGRVVGKRKNLSHEDIAHDALERIARYKAPPMRHLSNFVRFQVMSCYREFYTNKTTRKHDVMRDAPDAECDFTCLRSREPDQCKMVSAVDFGRDMLGLFTGKQEEILKARMQGVYSRELASKLGCTHQNLQMHWGRIKPKLERFLKEEYGCNLAC